MPTPRSFVVGLRGDPAYARALDRTLRAARQAGIQVTTRNDLAEVALASLAMRLGVQLPRRCPPVGTNRFGEPKAG